MPLLVVIALVVLAAFTGVVWLAYTQGVERGRASVSREMIARDAWTIKKTNVPPYTGLKIYEPASTDQNAPGSAGATKRTAVNTIPALRPSANAILDSAPPAPAKASAAQGKPPAEQTAAKEPNKLAPAAPPLLAHPLVTADSAPAARVSVTAPSGSEPSQTVLQKAATPKTVVPTAPGTPPAQAGIFLQIGSYKSETEARQSWNAFKAEHPTAAAYQPDVKSADLGAKGMWYRLRMGSFEDRKSAVAACEKLKADGASCLLAE